MATFVMQEPKSGAGSSSEVTAGRASTRVSRPTLTCGSPSTHPAREVQMLKRHCVGEVQGERGADFTELDLPRPSPFRLVTVQV
jgi:hypothetical protein